MTLLLFGGEGSPGTPSAAAAGLALAAIVGGLVLAPSAPPAALAVHAPAGSCTIAVAPPPPLYLSGPPLLYCPATVARTGRVYLLHGLNTTITAFVATSPFDSLVSGLRGQGWDVVVVAEPFDGPGATDQSSDTAAYLAHDPTDGQAVRLMWVSHFTAIQTWVRATYGDIGPEAALGISWGGLMCEMLAGSVPLRAFACHLPATDPSFLTEFSGLNTSGVLPGWGNLGTTPGWVSWSEADTRVGYTATVATYTAMHAADPHVTGVDYPTLGHATTSAVVSDLLAWFATV